MQGGCQLMEHAAHTGATPYLQSSRVPGFVSNALHDHPLLTMALLTMALLTMALLTVALLTMAHRPP